MGQAGLVRVGKGKVDFTFIVFYMPPRPKRATERETYGKIVTSVITWMKDEMAKLPSRTTPILLGDLYDDFGIQMTGEKRL